MQSRRDVDTQTQDRERVERTATDDFASAQRALFEAVGVEPRSQFVELDDLPTRIHVFETGTPTDDPPVVFVHGTAAFGAFFAPLMAHLEDRHLIAFDRPGYGLSGPFTYTEENIRQTVVATLEGVLDGLGIDQADVVGHSMGGHTGIRFALAHPERVRRLVLLGAVPAFPGTRPPLPLRLLTVPLLDRVIHRLQKPGEAGVLDIAEIFGEREAIQDHPAFIRAIAAHERHPDASTAGQSEFAALFSILGWHESIRIRANDLQSLQTPTTVVWGEHDTLAGPDAVMAGLEQIPNVQLRRVPTGHIPYLARPVDCAEVIRHP